MDKANLSRKQATKPKRSTATTTGVKVLITAASVAATVGGWAQLAHHNSETVSAAQQSPTPEIAQASQPTLQLDALSLPNIPSVPTVIPPLDFSSLTARASGASDQVVAIQPTAVPVLPTFQPVQPTHIIAHPTAVPARPTPTKSQPKLKQVTPPQPPVRAVTRSSR